MGEVILKENQRIEWLDTCKAIAILLVSFGHILGNVNENNMTRIFTLMCYSIELPMFFMIAGIQFRSNGTEKKQTKEYVFKRLQRIIYPYITFSFLYISFDAIIQVARLLGKKSTHIDVLYWDVIDTISFWGIGPLWFLATLFMAELLFYFIIKFKSRYIVSAIIILWE